MFHQLIQCVKEAEKMNANLNKLHLNEKELKNKKNNKFVLLIIINEIIIEINVFNMNEKADTEINDFNIFNFC